MGVRGILEVLQTLTHNPSKELTGFGKAAIQSLNLSLIYEYCVVDEFGETQLMYLISPLT